MREIKIGDCTLVHHGNYCTNYYPDGTESSNWAHPDDQFYKDIASHCGFSPDELMEYCFQHEFVHSFLPLKFFGRESYVVNMSAHQRKASISAAMMEERMVYYFQRFMHDKTIVPMDNDWYAYREEALQILKDSHNGCLEASF